MLNNKELDNKLSTRPAPRVTKEQIDKRIAGKRFLRMSTTLTHCVIELDNDYNVTGESACVSPENYDREIGERIAYDNAYAKLWPLFGFLLAEDLYVERLERGRN